MCISFVPGSFLKTGQNYRSYSAALISAVLLSSCGSPVSQMQATSIEGSVVQSAEQAPPGIPTPEMFAGNTGQSYGWKQLFEAMDAADVIVIGEWHADARGHVIQAEIIATALQRWDGAALSLEEFDRSQQAEVDAFQRGELTATELKAVRNFVMPAVRDNWMDWNLPKLEAARQAGAPVLASNAPLQYSRMVRNTGCDNLPDLSEEQLALFDCPAAPEDPLYKARFAVGITSAISRNKPKGLKSLGTEQIDRMFRAQRVWDATMAASIVQAHDEGARKVLHVVGNVHSDFDGGLIQELNYRDPDSRVLVISVVPTRSCSLLESDLGRADIVIYAGACQAL